MSANLHLLIHNLGFGLSGFAALGLVFITLYNNHRRAASITFALSMVAISVFIFSHMIGVSVADHELSRKILMFNISVMFVIILNTHCVLAILGKDQKRRWLIFGFYIFGAVITLAYVVFPETFLLTSVPKMYFPNYYVPGPYHWLLRVSHILFFIYFQLEILFSYRASRDKIEKNRYLYASIASFLGWGVGFIPILLVYNIPVDPAFGSLFIFLYAIPLVYAIISYELFDIKIIAKKALAYGIAIVGIGLFISLLNTANQSINNVYPQFPSWVMPFISAVITVIVGVVVWRKLREEDLLKYEFVTTASHKFRTPLTHIKWAAENLSETELKPEQRVQVENIKRTNNRLIELVNLLLSLTEPKTDTHNYRFRRGDLSELAEKVVATFRDQVAAKRLKFTSYLQPKMEADFDPARIKFVIEMLIENAVTYTPEGGSVTVATRREGSNVIFIVQDTGIGLTGEDISLIFSRFYRTADAKLADTEGMGIGLFLSREILTKHGGKIWVHSDGPKLGTTVGFSILSRG